METKQNNLAGGGECGALLRTVDWANHALGVPAQWPAALQTVVAIVLAANQPMFVIWGKAQTLIYNDPYARILGGKHPQALAQPFFSAWSELRDAIGSIVESAYRGEPTSMDDIKLTMLRNGFPEETHFSFFYAPVRTASGDVEGVFCACNEITDGVMTQQRVAEEGVRQRKLFDIAPGFVAILQGPAHEIEFVNESFRALHPDQELLGKSILGLGGSPSNKALATLVRHVAETGKRGVASDLEFEVVGLDETVQTIHLDFICQDLRGPDGEVTGMFLQGTDTSVAFRARHALRQGSERFQGRCRRHRRHVDCDLMTAG